MSVVLPSDAIQDSLEAMYRRSAGFRLDHAISSEFIPAHCGRDGFMCFDGIAGCQRYRVLFSTVTQFVTAEPPTLKVTPTSGAFPAGFAPIGSPTSCL